MDISSLYTEIPNNEGLQTLKYLFFEPTSCWRTLFRLNWCSHLAVFHFWRRLPQVGTKMGASGDANFFVNVKNEFCFN